MSYRYFYHYTRKLRLLYEIQYGDNLCVKIVTCLIFLDPQKTLKMTDGLNCLNYTNILSTVI